MTKLLLAIFFSCVLWNLGETSLYDYDDDSLERANLYEAPGFGFGVQQQVFPLPNTGKFPGNKFGIPGNHQQYVPKEWTISPKYHAIIFPRIFPRQQPVPFYMRRGYRTGPYDD